MGQHTRLDFVVAEPWGIYLATNSILSRVLRRSAKIEPDEMPVVIAAFVLFFAVFAGYFAVRPVRETVGTILGRERVEDLFVVTWVVSIGVVMLYATLVARIRRAVLLPTIYGAVALLLAVIGTVLKINPADVTVSAVFYVLISVVNLFIVSVFWSFLLEVFTSEQTKRLFGVIAVGGTAGALVGPMLTDLLVGHIGNPGILYMGAAFFVVAIVCQRSLISRRAVIAPVQNAAGDRPVGSANPFAGMMLVLKSPYLLGIAAFMVLLSSVTTFLYMEQLDIVKNTFSDPQQRTQVFSRIDYIVQSLTIVFQFFVTGRIAQRFGVVTLLTVVPLLMVAGFLGLAATGTFAVLAMTMVLRRVGEYAFIRPGREMLYSVVDTETKYKAKSFNDVPVYRGGDALAAQAQGLLKDAGVTAAAIAVLGAGMAALWAFTGWRLGRKVK
jgi:AAA family ATP:ADP antiporter